MKTRGLLHHQQNKSPIHIVALIDLLLFTSLYFYFEGAQAMLVVGGIKLTINYLVYGLIKKLKWGETFMSSLVAVIFSLGLVMQFRLNQDVATKQFTWYLIGIVAYALATLTFPYALKTLRSFWLNYGAIVALFVVTLVFGTEINGAKNWLVIGGVSFQASEVIKVIFVSAMAAFVAAPHQLEVKLKNRVINPKWTLMALVYLLLGFFVLQREFGTALVVFMVYLSVLYVFEKQMWFTLGNVALASGVALVALNTVSHLQVRVSSWLNPYADMSGKGYQITQSMFSIGSGSFFGVGIGKGYPKLVPNVSTDFIFSAICEEMGIFVGIGVLLMFFLLVYRGIKVSLQLKDPFTKSFAFGLSMLIGYQTFVIVGGVIKVIPLTGITLPFMSYGGSALISNFIMLGLLQALSGTILKKEVTQPDEIHNQ